MGLLTLLDSRSHRDAALYPNFIHFTLKARSRVLTLAARSVGFLLRTRGRAFTLETWAGEDMTNRAFVEGRKLQGVEESIPYTVTTTEWGSSPSSVSVKVFDVTADFADVTATVMPTGSPSVSGDVITLPALKLLTETHLYRVEVKFTCSGNIFEAYGEILAER